MTQWKMDTLQHWKGKYKHIHIYIYISTTCLEASVLAKVFIPYREMSTGKLQRLA